MTCDVEQRREDAGATLVELVVGMSVMAVAAAIFTAGMLQIRGSAARNEKLATAQAQLHQAFQRMDRDLRYAAGISEPAHTGGAWWVEYTVTTAGVTRCTQLRITDAGGLLQSRTRTGTGAVGAWGTLAAHLNGPRDFTRTAARSGGARHQQLAVTLTLSAGGTATRQSAYTFTALNTSPATGDDVCGGLVRS